MAETKEYMEKILEEIGWDTSKIGSLHLWRSAYFRGMIKQGGNIHGAFWFIPKKLRS